MDGRIEKGQGTRARLVATAVALFGRDGYEATSVEAVLRASGMSRGALYHHFADKKALFEAALRQVHADNVQATIDAARDSADGIAALRAGCAAWIRLASVDKVRRIMLIDAPAVVGWESWRRIEAEYSFAVVLAGLRAAARRGIVPTELVEPIGHVLVAAHIEMAMLIATADDQGQAEAAALATLDLLFERLLNAPLANVERSP
ncbi:MAG: TetR/AcrR family transcriptional regulator [Alphaproteobacteria bacterium]